MYIDNLSLRRETTERYRARFPARDFTLDLTMEPTQQLLLTGRTGLQPQGPSGGPGGVIVPFVQKVAVISRRAACSMALLLPAFRTTSDIATA
ncbi:lipocalin-like domain-containing protein [Cupriavidus necator]|uniref:lipocalin-like domain-containing protein n=1 Tax=Cupriavidus necator TaxID=106590 RepID=UPI0020BEB8DF|nr:lipocalin-like domain-containing protein [Cupriavidus necator]